MRAGFEPTERAFISASGFVGGQARTFLSAGAVGEAPVVTYNRLTEAGDRRVTEGGDVRVIESAP